ncbi:MAG: cation-translocating P-type ATPase [Anaerolineae bacterium]|nr:cation-translocating P-type ATPase [Anaerolineae bacterium]
MDSRSSQSFRVTGMDCAECARTIESGVARLDGVRSCAVNFAAGTLRVEGEVAPEVVVTRVRELGYDARPEQGTSRTADDDPSDARFSVLRFLLSRRDTTLALVGAILILPGLVFDELLPFWGVESVAFELASIAALVVAGYPIARSAWRSLIINRRININVLMTIAAIGAVIIGAYTEAGLVMVLFALGEALEGYTTERTRRAIRSLMAIAPNEATVLRPCMDCREHLGRDGYGGGPCPFCGLHEQRVPVSELRIGDVIVVKPGERIAMDGRVRAGTSSVNQAPITGESIPVTRQPGDEVFAGAINGEGALEVEVTRRAEDNVIARIIRMVEEAQERKAPTERFVDRFARYYTPAVVGLACALAIAPPLLFGAPLMPTAGDPGWLYRALELLVVACPCALVISTPVAVISAIGNAARHGVLIKGGAYLEALAGVRAMAFDKTGTLTEGKPSVIKVKAVNCTDPIAQMCDNCADLLALASAVERRSEHPLARAVVTAAEDGCLNARYPSAEAVKAIAGRGVSGRVAEREVIIGSHAHFDQVLPHDRALCDEIEALAAEGVTPVLVGADGALAGYIGVADAVRQTSRQAIGELHRSGIRATVMLTGDNAHTARAVARQLGITEAQAELLPEQKVAAIRALRDRHGAVAMIGDGVNDAPALAAANVGIAVGGGTAQAIETADIVLMSDDLRKLPFALQLSRAAMRAIRVNIALAIGIKLAVLGLVLLGAGTMWLAVLADVGASLLVTWLGMRLLGYRPSATAAPN